MRSPQTKIAVATAVVGAVMLGLLIYAMLQQAEITCEVCVTYRGGTQCRTAAGPDQSQAVRTATDNACGLLAGGMADSMSCMNTPPDSVACDN